MWVGLLFLGFRCKFWHEIGEVGFCGQYYELDLKNSGYGAEFCLFELIAISVNYC